MKEMTFGTFISCLFLAFMLGFLACHKLYMGLEKKNIVNANFLNWNKEL